ncbi:MAG: uracil-DNA glycosylase, partial [Marinoscillum sp.]
IRNMNVRLETSWKAALNEEFNKEYFLNLVEFVRAQYAHNKIYPPGSQIFNAFEFCPLSETKVVIIGQDPYHGEGQANGLCFSVAEGIRMPPSLVNIFKELKSDLGNDLPPHGSLERWARQGVLLLNATLTVKASSPGSHQNKGWEEFTDAVIKVLSEKQEGIVFILWGAYAQKKGAIIDESRHFVIRSAHPSPFAAHRGFFGSRPFSKTNEYLTSRGKPPINW